MVKKYRNTGITLLLALGTVLPASGLAAAPGKFDDHSIKVSYADLNIHSEVGAKVLYSRLKLASQKVCDVGSYWQHGSMAEARNARVCFREALSRAVANIDSEALHRIHAG